MKFVMVSRMEFEFNDDMDTEDFDFTEAINNGDIKINIPELSFLDDDGNELIEENVSEVISEIMTTLKGEA